MSRINSIRTQIQSELFGASEQNKISNTEIANIVNDLNDQKANDSQIANFQNIPSPSTATDDQAVLVKSGAFVLGDLPSGLTEQQVDQRILQPARQGDTSEWPKNKLPSDIVYTANLPTIPDTSNFVTQTQVDNRILPTARAGDTSRWAKSKLPSDIVYDADLPTIPDVSSFQTEAQVDARVQALVADEAENGNTTRWSKSKLPSDTVYTADLPTQRTDAQINTLIDNRIPVAQRVLTGGTNGQIYSRTSTGYAWVDSPAGLNQTQVDARINAVIPANTRVPSGGATGYVLKKDSANDYDFSWQADATSTGNTGGLNQTQVDARIETLVPQFGRDNTTAIPSAKLQNAMKSVIQDPNEITASNTLLALNSFYNVRISANAGVNLRLPIIDTANQFGNFLFFRNLSDNTRDFSLDPHTSNSINDGANNETLTIFNVPEGALICLMSVSATNWQVILDTSNILYETDIIAAAKVGFPTARWAKSKLPTDTVYATTSDTIEKTLLPSDTVYDADILGLLNQNQVDARIITQARINNTDRWLKNKLPTDTVYDADIANFITASDIPAAPDISGIQTNATAISNLTSRVTANETAISNIDTQTDAEVNALIDARIPVAQRVISGGTNGQIYSRTSTGYAWIDAPSGSGSSFDLTADHSYTGTNTFERGKLKIGTTDALGVKHINFAATTSGTIPNDAGSATVGVNMTNSAFTLTLPSRSSYNGGERLKIVRRAGSTNLENMTIQVPTGSSERIRDRTDTAVTSITLGKGQGSTNDFVELEASIESTGDTNWLVTHMYEKEATASASDQFDPKGTAVTTAADDNLFPIFTGDDNDEANVISGTSLKTFIGSGSGGISASDDIDFTGGLSVNGVRLIGSKADTDPKNLGGVNFTTASQATSALGRWQLISGGDTGVSIDLDDYPDDQEFDVSYSSPGTTAQHSATRFIISKQLILSQDTFSVGDTSRGNSTFLGDVRDNGNVRYRFQFAKDSQNRILIYLRDITSGTASDANIPSSGIGFKILTQGTQVVPTSLIEPLNFHLGVKNIDSNDSAVPANSGVSIGATSEAGQTGDIPVIFNRSFEGVSIPNGVTYNENTGEITLSRGAWLLCFSAKVRNQTNNPSSFQNTRNWIKAQIREGATDVRHSNEAYSRWSYPQRTSAPSVSNISSFYQPAVTVAGSVISDGVTPVTCRLCWEAQTTGGILILTAHVHGIKQ